MYRNGGAESTLTLTKDGAGYVGTTHLRGEAGDRQIENARVGLAHVIGPGSACGVHILERSAA